MGRDEDMVQRALRALYVEPYLQESGKEEIDSGDFWYVGAPTGQGLRVAGAVQRRDLNAHKTLVRTRWPRLLDVDDAEHLCGVAKLFNLDGAHIDSSPLRVRPL